ncbi:MAG: transketolase [Actinobacteria bacterium]|nr:MAG: transketolase [Actinomycetota bacterium]
MDTSRPLDAAQLAELSKELRVDIIQMLVEAGSGHPGGSLSAIDALACLYFGGVLRYKPDEPHRPGRDRFVLSKGHCSPAMYVTLARAGFFPHDWLKTFRKFESRLQGHVDRLRVPGVDASTGSLGQGLSIAVGMAITAKLDKADWRVYCMLGDGESQAGQVWEATMSAPKFALDNLCAIVDNNQVQQTGLVDDVMPLRPLVDKFRAFNWHAIEIDGHDHAQVLAALHEAQATTEKPTAIVSHTIKGKGVSWMELNPEWHGKAPNAEQGERAIAEIMGRKP